MDVNKKKDEKSNSSLTAVNYDSYLDVKHLEKEAAGDGGTAKVKEDSETKHITKEKQHSRSREDKGLWRRGSPAILAASVLLVVGTAATLLISPALLLVNMKENLVNDLNDSMGAYYTYTKKVIEGQIGGVACGEKSIRCKFATMSPMLKERFEGQNIKLAAVQNQSNKRYNVSAAVLPEGNGAVASGKALNELAKRVDDVRYRVDNVVDPKNGIFHDRKFAERLFERFHLQHGPAVQGLEKKDIDDSFNEALKSDADFIDMNGQGVFGLHYLAQSTPRWQTDIYANLVGKVHNHMALACALHTYGNLADDAARRAKSVTLARFAMQFVSIADVIKSGENASYEMVVSDLSDRLSVQDGRGRNALDGSSFRVPALNEAVSLDRMPHLRKYMNSAASMLAILSAGTVGAPGSEHLRLTPQRVQTANSSGSIDVYDLCKQSMSGEQAMYELVNKCWQPGSMAVAGHVGVVAGGQIQGMRSQIEDEICSVTPSGTSPAELAKTAAQAANYLAALQEAIELTKTAIMAEATTSMSARVGTSALTEAANFSARTVGIAAQDAIFSGTGVILGDVAQSIGMRPASAVSLQEYLVESMSAHQEIARGNQLIAAKNQFDITNPHTFLGMIAQSAIGERTSPFSSVMEAAASVVGVVPRSFSTLAIPATNALYSQPLNFRVDRMISAAGMCGVAGMLEAKGVNPDFACNIRYSMSKLDLNRSIPEVVNYMTQAHPENAEKSLSEVQQRDIIADPIEGARMQSEASQGSRESYIDRVTGKPNMNTEYGKFMQYCVNRPYAWGTVGMAVQHREKAYTPDGKDPFDPERRIYSGSAISAIDSLPQADTSILSSFGVAWGSSDDQKWLSGEKCLEESNMLSNFRAYTVACRVLAGMSGSRECWHEDAEPTFHTGFYPRNNIVFKKEN